MHPASQDNHIGLIREHELCEISVVSTSRVSQLGLVLLASSMVALVDKVEVLGGHAGELCTLGGVSCLAIDNYLADRGVGDCAVCAGVEDGLKVGAIAGAHDKEVA